MADRSERRLEGEARRLAEDYWPLALKLIGPWQRRHPWLCDEFVSEAGLALTRVAGRIRPGWHRNMPRLLRARIPGACQDVVRREFKRDHYRLEGLDL